MKLYDFSQSVTRLYLLAPVVHFKLTQITFGVC